MVPYFVLPWEDGVPENGLVLLLVVYMHSLEHFSCPRMKLCRLQRLVLGDIVTVLPYGSQLRDPQNHSISVACIA